MRRILLLSVLTLLLLAAITAGLGWHLLNDPDFLKARLGAWTLQQTGRQLRVDGPLQLRPGRLTVIEARGIRFQNAAWGTPEDMATLGRLRVVIDVPSLFDEVPVIPSLLVEDCDIRLQRNEAGEANWNVIPESADKTEQPRTSAMGPPVQLLDARLMACRLSHDAPDRERPLSLDVRELALRLVDGKRWHASGAGRVNDEDFSFAGGMEPAGALLNAAPLGYEMELALGAIALRSSGTVENPRTGQGADLGFEFSGPEMTKVLEHFNLPLLSEGAFDFRLSLDSEDRLTNLQLDGDLGSLELNAEGQVDRLVWPHKGALRMTLSGPDLQLLGEAAGVDNLVPEPYSARVDLGFDGGVVHADSVVLETPHDRVELSGVLGRGPRFAASDLTIRATTPDIGRWRARARLPATTVGPATLEATLRSDAAGRFSTEAEVGYAGSTLQAEGPLGAVDDAFEPALSVTLRSPDAAALAARFGVDKLPAAPFSAQGRVSRTDGRLRVEDLDLELAGHRARIDGDLNPGTRFAGSEFRIRLDSPDIADLASLFGTGGVPHEALKLSLQLQPENGGLRFQASDGSVGDITLDFDGRIADLDEPLGLDANFDIRLPSLTLLGFLAPGAALPDLPFTARGRLRNEQTRTTLEGVQFALGTMVADVSGDVYTDRRFALAVDASGPDASELGSWARGAPQPFSARATLEGDTGAFEVRGLDAELGASSVQGELRIALAEPRRISGRLASAYLDLNPFLPEEDREAGASPPEPRYVFDDTPVTGIGDLGADLDIEVSIARLDHRSARIQDVELGVRLAGGLLELKPLALRGAGGGSLSGNLTLDAGGEVPELRMDLAARGFRLGLAAPEAQAPASLPPLDVDISLRGRGATERQMASSLNGRIRWSAGSGQILASRVKLLFGDFLSQLFEALNPFGERSKYTTLECAVSAATIVDGRVRLYPSVHQTEQITIFSQGAVDLHTEKIDISFNTKPRQGLGISAGALINPLIKVGGRLAAPAIQLNPTGAAVSGGLAVATAGLSLLAKSAYDRFLSSKDPCGDARREIEKLDQAGNP